jgi:copper chaperone CopZ
MTKLIRTVVIALVLMLPVTAYAAKTQYKLEVDGLACPFCAYGIEKKLNSTKGLENIDIDINAGTVTVTMAKGATMSRAQASRIVKDAGFSLRAFTKLRR